MKYILEIPDDKVAFAEEFFKSVSFLKNAKPINEKHISNATLLDNIEAYEQGKIKPTPLSLNELKAMIDA
ncbi:MAG: hypothetical protein H6553_12645 [Chitinophagales bacterium]|nr:hypothetical protein [Chitinophagales bacterium]